MLRKTRWGEATLCLPTPRSRIAALTQLLPVPALESRGTGTRFATEQGGRQSENRRESQQTRWQGEQMGRWWLSSNYKVKGFRKEEQPTKSNLGTKMKEETNRRLHGKKNFLR